MRILYFNNCWFTNVGEAFIDIGGMALIKQVFPEADIACISAMSDYYISTASASNSVKKRFGNRKQEKGCIPVRMEQFVEADYVVLPGMVGTEEFLNASSRKMIDELVASGCKVIFLGLGGYEYTEQERIAFSKYIESVNPALIMSRDNVVYDYYKDVAECVKGIDCAFWSIDQFDPRGFSVKDYDVVTFNRSDEPNIFKEWKKPVIRPWHMQYGFDNRGERESVLISDTPYDYLTVYANANNVYTDLVHASIISLMYNVPVKYWYIDKRSYAFEALNGIIMQEFMSVSPEKLKAQKVDVVKKMKEKLG